MSILLGDGPHLRVELVKANVLYKTSELDVRIEEASTGKSNVNLGQ